MKKKSVVLLLLIATLLMTACSAPTIDTPSDGTPSESTQEETAYLNVMSQEEFDLLYRDEDIRNYARMFIGKEMPNLSIYLPGNDAFDMASLKGSSYIIEFMGTWCPVCTSIKPHIEEFRRLYPHRQLFTVGFDNTEAELNEFIEENGFTQPIHMRKTPLVEFDRMFNLRFVPTFFFVGEDGIVQYVFIGDITTDMLDKMYTMSFGFENEVVEMTEDQEAILDGEEVEEISTED